MNKLKHIVFSVAKAFVIILSVLSLLLVIFALGKPEKLTTQIGTIFGPMLLPILIISLVILTGVELIFLIKKGKGNYLQNKLSIIAMAFSVVALVSTSLLWHSMCSAVRDNGGSISVFDGFSMFKNPSDDEKVVYATHDGENLTISVYKNKEKTDGSLSPVYVYIHGGGWQSSDSESNGVMHRNMSDSGYLGFSINYRLCTDDVATWDTAIYDCAEAMNWIYAHAEEYGGDPNRIVLSGESAGGHLALLYTGRVTDGSLDAPIPQAVCVMYPAVDLKWVSENARYLSSGLVPGIVERFIGGSLDEYPERVEAIDPFTYINENMPPVLIIHGEKDTLVSVTGSEAYVAKLSELGVKNKLVEIPFCNHGTIGNETLIRSFLKDIEGMSVE